MEKYDKEIMETGNRGSLSYHEDEIKSLFHYCKANEFSELIVRRKQLYFSSPINFNDPFEYYVEEEVEKNKVEDITKKGIVCLSAAEPTKNTLMWSHYADKHKGLCFEFEKAEFELFYDDTEKRKVKYEIKKVDYETANKIPLLTKDSSWKYEMEYRIILDYEKTIKENKYQRTFIFEKQCLNKIYFGVNVSPDVIEKYKSLCTLFANDKEHRIQLYQMEISGQYLFKEPIEIQY